MNCPVCGWWAPLSTVSRAQIGGKLRRLCRACAPQLFGGIGIGKYESEHHRLPYPTHVAKVVSYLYDIDVRVVEVAA